MKIDSVHASNDMFRHSRHQGKQTILEYKNVILILMFLLWIKPLVIPIRSKVLSVLQACFDLISAHLHHSKMQKDSWAKYIRNFAFI